VSAILVAPAAGNGLGADYARGARRAPCAVGIAVGIGFVALTTGWWSLPLLAAALVGTLAVVVLALRKIGGLVGDVLGAIEQVVECLVLIVVSGLAARHGIWWHR
jgi:adenosylcobinamide-GDP ribazoletransferase